MKARNFLEFANPQTQQFRDRRGWDDGRVLGHELNLTTRLGAIENLVGYLLDSSMQALQN